jgi:AAA domain
MNEKETVSGNPRKPIHKKEKIMIQGKLIPITNVKNAIAAIQYLHTRPLQEMVGLGLIYGQPGVGKSRLAKMIAIQEGYIYIRLDATTSARSFLASLYKWCQRKEGVNVESVYGSSALILSKIVDILKRKPYTIIVDEIDYAFGKKELLGTIRDIVDHTFSVVLMIGESTAKEDLLIANAHYFDRCNAFVRFELLSRKDTGIYLAAVSEVAIDNDLIDHVYQKTTGNLRNVVNELRKIESLAKKGKLLSVTMKDYQESAA